MRNGRTLCARRVMVCLAIVAMGTNSVGIANAEVITRLGVRSATLGWTEPDGFINGYLVFVSRNGGPSEYESFAATNRYTVTGNFQDEVVIEIKAVGSLTEGDPVSSSGVSEESPAIRFFPAFNWDTSAAAILSSPSDDDVRIHLFKNPNSRYAYPGRSEPWEIATVGDFNGDQLDDVAWRNLSNGHIEIAPIHAPQTRLAIASGSNIRDQIIRGSGDFNGDGATDFILHNTVQDRVRVFAVNSDGILHQSTPFDGLKGDDVIGVADLDANGADDVWTRNSVTGRIEVFRADGGGAPFATYVVPALGTTVDHVADLDDNGIPDLLWRTSTGSFAVTYLGPNGQVQRNVSYPANADDPDFDVAGAASIWPASSNREVLLHNRRNGSLWMLAPSIENRANRIKLMDAEQESWKPIQVFE